jgi:uncharacterized protein
MRPFTRCMKCNGVLEEALPPDPVHNELLQRLPPGVRHKNAFRVCPGCGRVYWEGSHHVRMGKMLDWVKSNTRYGE